MDHKEKYYASELLSGLDEKDIFELARTITKGKFTPMNKEEGVDLITRYESDLKSLLSRKKISSNLLSQYLHAKGVRFNIDVPKLSLCDTVLQYWQSIGQSTVNNKAITYANSTASADHEYSSTNIQSNVISSVGSNVIVPLDSMIRDNSNSQSYVTSNTIIPLESSSNINCQVVALSEIDVTNLGLQFVDWFFSQFRGPDLELREIGCEHFFSDASCRIHIGNDIREGVGGKGCATALNDSLKHISRAIPVPNSGGVRSEASPHGAIKILACGTLHGSQSRMLGAFEQAFLLVKDPSMADNWKIKFTELRLKAQGHEIEAPSQPSIKFH